ncbi:hypothetical protein V8G54_001292 [Vigna mungo]|uniref:Uncharacterized protein n=1 Tax=Vigna mungo TaxID=3915 RepID=A0AAQ3PA77_VIGMU
MKEEEQTWFATMLFEFYEKRFGDCPSAIRVRKLGVNEDFMMVVQRRRRHGVQRVCAKTKPSMALRFAWIDCPSAVRVRKLGVNEGFMMVAQRRRCHGVRRVPANTKLGCCIGFCRDWRQRLTREVGGMACVGTKFKGKVVVVVEEEEEKKVMN